jgi:hypothetical protein
MFFSPTISTGSTLNYTTGTITDYIYFPATSTSSTNFGQCIIDIFDYNHANKYKTIVAFGGTASASPNNRSAYNTYSWQSSAPITRLDFFGSSSSGFEVNTTIALYGIKG